LLVAVAESGTGNRVMTSPNGITWTTQTSAADDTWQSICWAAELGLLVAVSREGSVMTSPDGITWRTRTGTGTTDTWRSICWAAELGLLVAVALGGAVNRAITSS
jgi:hypothetical protein